MVPNELKRPRNMTRWCWFTRKRAPATVCDLESDRQSGRATGDTLLIVDGITSNGALPFKMDAWGIDIAITGSQKALMLPPGLGFVEPVRPRLGRGRPEQDPEELYFDMGKYRKSIDDGDTPFTPANTLIEACG